MILSCSIVNLTLLRYSYKSVLPEIARNLSLFPNLHTLQLIFQFYYSMELRFFSAFRYPNVHTLNLSRHSPHVDVLRACPNTKHLSFYKDIGDFRPDVLNSGWAGGIEKIGQLRGLEYHVARTSALCPYFECICNNLQFWPNASHSLATSPLTAKTCAAVYEIIPLYFTTLIFTHHLGKF